jgi:hypothetical protein
VAVIELILEVSDMHGYVIHTADHSPTAYLPEIHWSGSWRVSTVSADRHAAARGEGDMGGHYASSA